MIILSFSFYGFNTQKLYKLSALNAGPGVCCSWLQLPECVGFSYSNDIGAIVYVCIYIHTHIHI